MNVLRGRIGLILLLTVVITGCQSYEQQEQFGISENTNDGYQRFLQDDQQTVYGNRRSIVNLERKVTQINGIEQARAFIYDDTVVIGVRGSLTRENAEIHVYQRLKGVSRHNIVYVSVNDDEAFNRISRVRQRIMQGQWQTDTRDAARILINDLSTTIIPKKLE